MVTNMNYLSRMQKRWTHRRRKKPGYRVNGVMKLLSRRMSEDQLVIWKRLNEIRLSQDQDKVPALKKIAKRRIREELQVVEVVAQIQTKDIRNQQATAYHCRSSD